MQGSGSSSRLMPTLELASADADADADADANADADAGIGVVNADGACCVQTTIALLLVVALVSLV